MEADQSDLLSPLTELDFARLLLADLHDELHGKIARYRYLADISSALGSEGTMMPGGETVYTAWSEARTSYIHGNYMATVLLCQGMAEHMLAAQLTMGLNGDELPSRISFSDTLARCVEKNILTKAHTDDLKRLMGLRNPLSHYRNFDDPSNLSRRSVDARVSAEFHLRGDANFAIGVAVRLLALPAFRLDR